MSNQFSENLKKIRKDHNLSQEQLADEIGVSRQAISKWESAVAYPEMDKIIALCNKFNLNIDDLLHKDIREVKREEDSNKKLNNYINGFLNFITDTINLFSSMNFKNKFKCLFEQLIIIIFLFVVSHMLSAVFNSLIYSLFSFLPNEFRYFICNTLSILFMIVCIVFSVVILIHTFRVRYLNYYNNIKKSNDNITDIYSDIKLEKNKTDLKKMNDKIIIRDPKHSEYRFINGLFKFIIGTIKFFLLCFGLFVAFILVCLFVGFVLSFLLYKTGLFFIGLLISIISSSIMVIIILLLILNFVFNRTNDKKKMIWGFIFSLIFFGIGSGLIFSGALNFDVIEDNESLLKTEIREHEMKDDMIIYSYNAEDIEYIESKNENLKIEYKINKFCYIDEHIDRDNHNAIMAWTNCNNPMKLVREFIKGVNEKKILLIDDDIRKITVYTSKPNIDKLKSNSKNYVSGLKKYDEQISMYENQIDILSSENEELKQEIYDLQKQIED